MDRRLIAVGLVALLIGLLVFPVIMPQQTVEKEERTLERIEREGRIKVCYIHYPPLVIKDPNTGGLSGENIDAIEYIADESGIKVEYVESSWSTFSAALQSGKCDMVATLLLTLPSRAKSVSFTRPVIYLHNSVLIKKDDNRFRTLEDFNRDGIRIAVIQGEVGHVYAKKNLPNAELTVLPGADISLALAQVSSGRADAAFADGWSVEKYTDEHPETMDFLDVNPDAAYGINPDSWAVRHEDTDLLNFLNTAIYTLEADGKFLEFEEKYGAKWMRPKLELVKRE